MKNYALTLFLLLSASIVSAKSMKRLPVNYEVKADVFSDSIEKGTTLIQGQVLDDLGKGIQGAVIGEVSRTRYAVSDENGNYSLVLKSTDSTFYCYHLRYSEIVCWKYEFKSQHKVTIDFFPKENKVDFPSAVAEKPVIYLYSDQDIEVDLALTPKGEFNFTYPNYNNGWTANVSETGLEVDGKEYPYLFWEGEVNDLDFDNSATDNFNYFIQTDSAIQFLESTLAALGLNSKEMTDFITYWGPRITAHSYARLQFLVGEAYEDQVAALHVSPRPDSQLRIYLLFEGAERAIPPVHFSIPILPTFSRTGFTLIEWGGTELTRQKSL